MDRNQRIEFLRNNPIFWSRVGWGSHPSLLENGKIKLFGDWKDNLVYHQEMADKGGIKIHSSILPLGWVGVDEYNYQTTDEVLEELFNAVPDMYYIPRIKLDANLDWCRHNPEEVFVYANGPKTVDEISALVDTPLQDMLGFNSAGGEAFINGKWEKRPNFDGLIALQSFCSPKWQRDAGVALEKLITHIENSKYGDKILGYHIAYGCCGETTVWGTWERDLNRRGDYGITAQKQFFEYAKKSGMNVTEVPSPQDRYVLPSRHLQSLFYQTTQDDVCELYSRFLSQSNVEAIEYFGKIIRKICPEKLVGCFYGYIIEVLNSTHAGHLGIDALLQSDYVDFICGPKGYYRVDPCGPGVGEAPCHSINRKKLWLDELDNRTHLYQGDDPSKAKNFAQTRGVYWREFSKNLSFNQGYWWMDLGGGWLHDDSILQEIKLLNQTGQELVKLPQQRDCEVLILVDDDIMHRMRPVDGMQTFIEKFTCTLKECGTPIDFYRLKDFYEIDVSQYKVVVFLNAYSFHHDEVNKKIAQMRSDVHIVWNYISGAIDGEYSLDNVKKITSFCVEEIADTPEVERYVGCKFPLIKVLLEDGVEVIKTYSHGDCSLAKRKLKNGKTYYLNAMPTDMTVEDVRRIYKNAQVHLYAPMRTTVNADNRFIYVIAGEKKNFTLRLKGTKNVENVFTKEKFYQINQLDVCLEEGNGVFLKYI